MSNLSKPAEEISQSKLLLSTTIPTIIYTLYLISIFMPGVSIVGVIMAYVNRGTESKIIESHYQFQIRTFWIGLLYFIISSLLTLIVIGWLLLFFYLIWLVIRCTKGIKHLNQQQAIPEPKSWLFGNH